MKSVSTNLLLVEDEPLIRLGLADTCERIGFVVAEAQDGVEALAILRNHPGIGVVVTDIDMPRMDGLELTRVIHRDFPTVAVVLMSGKTYARTDDLPRDVPFFEKPINEVALASCLSTFRGSSAGV